MLTHFITRSCVKFELCFSATLFVCLLGVFVRGSDAIMTQCKVLFYLHKQNKKADKTSCFVSYDSKQKQVRQNYSFAWLGLQHFARCAKNIRLIIWRSSGDFGDLGNTFFPPNNSIIGWQVLMLETRDMTSTMKILCDVVSMNYWRCNQKASANQLLWINPRQSRYLMFRNRFIGSRYKRCQSDVLQANVNLC